MTKIFKICSILSLCFIWITQILSAQTDTVTNKVFDTLLVEDVASSEITQMSKAQIIVAGLTAKLDTIKEPEVIVKPVSNWKLGFLGQLGFSQVSLTNWAEGGTGSIAMNAYIDVNANYTKNDLFWENRGQFSYGFIESLDETNQFKKSEDQIYLTSKLGYKMVNNIYYSTLFSFKSQMFPGYDSADADRKIVSNIFSPAYISLGIGLDWKPIRPLSVNFSPFTGNMVIVEDRNLRTTYGNEDGQFIRGELGAQLKIEYKNQFEVAKVNTSLLLFSDYLNNPQNIQVYWQFDTTFNLSKYISATLRTNVIYNDNIKIPDSDGNNAVARLQVKEIFSLALVYTFGNYVKKK